MSDKRNTEILDWMARAYETLEDARILVTHNRGNSSINRLYYAAFYSVTALLLTQNLRPTTHRGVQNLFMLHFVRTGVVTSIIGVIYTDLYQQRHETDYELQVRISMAELQEWIEKTTRLIETIDTFIQQTLPASA